MSNIKGILITAAIAVVAIAIVFRVPALKSAVTGA